MHAYNLNFSPEAGGSLQVWVYSDLHSKFQARQGYQIWVCLKKQNKQNKNHQQINK